MSILVTGVLTGAALAGIIVIAPAVKQAVDLAPFLYANTRCSARTGALLTQNIYSELLASSSVSELYGILEDTAYSTLVEHAKNFADFSKALDKNLHDDLKWLATIVPSELSPILKAINLKFEINEIKSILNGLKTGNIPKELDFVLKDELKFKLQSVTDFASLTSAVEDTQYQNIFIGTELSQTEKINTKLDSFYIKKVMSVINKAPKKSAAAFKEYWRHVIDIFNVRLAIRKMNSAREDIEFLNGGFIASKSLSAVTDMTQLEGVLRSGQYTDFMTDMESLQIEVAFNKSLKSFAGLLNARHPLQAGYVVRYIILKDLELKTVNLIAKLKEENFGEDEIRKLTIW